MIIITIGLESRLLIQFEPFAVALDQIDGIVKIQGGHPIDVICEHMSHYIRHGGMIL
jgi:hypothetical protein